MGREVQTRKIQVASLAYDLSLVIGYNQNGEIILFEQTWYVSGELGLYTQIQCNFTGIINRYATGDSL